MHTWTKDMGATYRPGIVGTKPSVIPPVVADGSNPYRRWPGVSPGIIRYSFTDPGRMEGWVGLAARGGREICWYELHGESNLCRVHGDTMVYSLCYTNWIGVVEFELQSKKKAQDQVFMKWRLQ